MNNARFIFKTWKGTLAIMLLVAGCLVCRAADVASEFDAANTLYGQGKFAEAAAAYEKIVQSGSVSPALYFNLGNAFFKSGQLGLAVAAYRAAEKVAPRDPEVRANLQFVRNRVQGPTLAPTPIQRWLGGLSVNEWATLAAVVLWVWLGLLVLIQFRPALKQALRTFLWLGGVATIVAGGLLGTAWSTHSARTAVVITGDAVVRNGPLDEAPSEVTVHDGAELAVLDAKNGWFQVQVDSRRVGWVKSAQVVLTSGT